MYSSAFGDGVVYEDDLASAGIIGSREEHTVACDTGDTRGLKIGDNDYLFADELVGSVVVLDTWNDNTLVDAVGKSELVAGMRLSDLLTLDDLANTKV